MLNTKRSLFALSMIIILLSSTAFSQRKPKAKKPALKAQDIIFAVLNDGKTIEPIGIIDKGELIPAANTDNAPAASFGKEFYRGNSRYKIVFGGASNGTVTVKSSDPNSDCASYMATVASQMTKGKLGGNVMALATNATVLPPAKFMRRMPTAQERKSAESLVRAEFAKNNVTAKQLFSQNLTAIDVDHDGVAELVGSYYVKPDAKSRALLFFIAEKGDGEEYSVVQTSFSALKKDDIMNGELSSVDGGVYNELLLDSLEYDGDDVNEIFTYTLSFEGAGFKTYSKREGKWVVAFENSNYHCAF